MVAVDRAWFATTAWQSHASWQPRRRKRLRTGARKMDRLASQV
jgi:hypothetical protein